MEILVILMLALCLFAIAMFIVFFVMLKKRHQEKNIQKFDDAFDDDDDDDDDDEVLPSEKVLLERKDDVKQVFDSNEVLIEEEPVHENIVVPIMPLPLEEEDKEELVNILINQKNYIFLANGNTLQKGEQVKLVLNNKIYSGVITKANYQKDTKDFKVKPKALVIAKENKENPIDSFNEDFMPKKKVIEE